MLSEIADTSFKSNFSCFVYLKKIIINELKQKRCPLSWKWWLSYVGCGTIQKQDKTTQHNRTPESVCMSYWLSSVWWSSFDQCNPKSLVICHAHKIVILHPCHCHAGSNGPISDKNCWIIMVLSQVLCSVFK